MDLKGQRAFVTAGSTGIGAAIVKRLVNAGAEVVFTARAGTNGEAYGKEVGAAGITLDITDLDALSALVTKHGPFDILVNNAGMDQHAFFTKTTREDWRFLLTVNLESTFTTTHAALPGMQAKKYGRIVNISSEAGRLGSRGGSVYAAAKAGIIGFTKSLARENGKLGITVNVICPGPIDTPMLQQAVASGGEKLLDAMKSATQVGRLGTPDEVAAAVLFLVSNDAGFITGETLGVSGGMGIGG